jgi:hypothetical protein
MDLIFVQFQPLFLKQNKLSSFAPISGETTQLFRLIFWNLSIGARQREEIPMKKLTIFLIFLLSLFGCGTKASTPFGDSEAKPDLFCNLIQEPDPLLMGTWECKFTRYVGRSRPDVNYVKYQLRKYHDKYGLYFYRIWKSGRKKKSEWKDWDITGKEILGEARFGVKIFVQGKNVYFTIRGLDEPTKMSRVED